MAIPVFFMLATVATLALACNEYDEVKEVKGYAPKLENPASEKSAEEKTPTEKAVETLNE